VAIELPPAGGAFRHLLSASGVALEPINPLKTFLIFQSLNSQLAPDYFFETEMAKYVHSRSSQFLMLCHVVSAKVVYFQGKLAYVVL
jgi:hypothetical protein